MNLVRQNGSLAGNARLTSEHVKNADGGITSWVGHEIVLSQIHFCLASIALHKRNSCELLEHTAKVFEIFKASYAERTAERIVRIERD